MKRLLPLLAVLLWPFAAEAQAPDSRFSAGGYFRVMARPDLQGGDGRLGYWNLYGRLMNEGPWAALEMKLDMLQAAPGTNELWASLHARVEGGSVNAADPFNGSFASFRLSQLYTRAGNLLLPDVVWQLGTLQYYFGDLGLYDMRPAELLEDTVGLSARYDRGNVDVLLAVGDSGFATRGTRYVPFLTAGGALKVRLGKHVELGAGGQVALAPFIEGSRDSSYVTPGVSYEDYVRGEVLRHYLEEHPLEGVDQFPRPEPSSHTTVAWRAVGYLGFGKLGPLTWNNLFVRLQRRPPDVSYTDSWQGQSVEVYVADLTRDRTALTAGNELQLELWPGRLGLIWSALYGFDRDAADTVRASEGNRTYMSTVLRLQYYATRVVHLLLETSLAEERSLNGNLYRTNYDSIFESSGGTSNTRGLEYGDAATRDTWQLKTGVVFNPTGPGIYTRPSIRLLYGFQYSTQHAAFDGAFAERLADYDAFTPTKTVSWHHLISLEAEGWF